MAHASLPPLTTRQKQVARLVLADRTDREIAAELGISVWTVRTYLGQLRERLQGTGMARVVVERHRARLLAEIEKG